MGRRARKEGDKMTGDGEQERQAETVTGRREDERQRAAVKERKRAEKVKGMEELPLYIPE